MRIYLYTASLISDFDLNIMLIYNILIQCLETYTFHRKELCWTIKPY